MSLTGSTSSNRVECHAPMFRFPSVPRSSAERRIQTHFVLFIYFLIIIFCIDIIEEAPSLDPCKEAEKKDRIAASASDFYHLRLNLLPLLKFCKKELSKGAIAMVAIANSVVSVRDLRPRALYGTSLLPIIDYVGSLI